MNLNNSLSLLNIALLAGHVFGAKTLKFDRKNFDDQHPVEIEVDVDENDIEAVKEEFKKNGNWLKESILNKAHVFATQRGDIFDDMTGEKLLSFIVNSTPENYKQLTTAEHEKILRLINGSSGFKQEKYMTSEKRFCAFVNLYASTLPIAAPASRWPKNIPAEAFSVLVEEIDKVSFDQPISEINRISDEFIQVHAPSIVAWLCKTKQIGLVDKEFLGKVFKVKGAVSKLTKKRFGDILKNPDLAALFNPDIFIQLNDEVFGMDYKALVRNLPENVYSKVNKPLHSDYLKFATAEQLSNFQIESIKEASTPSLIDPDVIPPRLAGKIPVNVWVKYFTQALSGTEDQKRELFEKCRNWTFWKRIDVEVIKALAKNHDLGVLLPAEAFSASSLEQRALILKLADDENWAVNCLTIPFSIFIGKERRTHGLSASKNCFDARAGKPNRNDNDYGFLILGLSVGAFPPEFAKDLPMDAFKTARIEVPRPDKIDADGNVVKSSKNPYFFEGVTALEALKSHARGADIVNAFFSHTEAGYYDDLCQNIKLDQLRKAKWLQKLLPASCISNITIGSTDVVKKLDENIWANLTEEQLKPFVTRPALKTLEGPFLAGLARNKAFAKLSVEIEKKIKGGAEVDRKILVSLIKPAELRKYFGAAYVNNIPDDEQSQKSLVQILPSLADDALAGVNGKWIEARPEILKSARPEQYGRISDNVEEDPFSASLQAGQVGSLSIDQVKNLSAKFVGNLSANALAGFTADQIKQLKPESLVLVCGDKKKALKGLSEEQKKSMGSSCEPDNGNGAPSNANIGTFAIVAAVAAGSLAVLL